MFNAQLSYFADFILCPTDKNMFNVINKKIWFIFWMCTKLKIKTAWHSFGVFIVDFDRSQHINIVGVLLTLNKYLSVGSERHVIMFWKHKKLYICFVIKRAISFSNLSVQGIEINYEHMIILWTYNEHMFQLLFCSRNPKRIIIVSSRYLIYSIIAISQSQRFNLFCCIKPKTYLHHWNSETN